MHLLMAFTPRRCLALVEYVQAQRHLDATGSHLPEHTDAWMERERKLAALNAALEQP